jgi:hypothetical protein
MSIRFPAPKLDNSSTIGPSIKDGLSLKFVPPVTVLGANKLLLSLLGQTPLSPRLSASLEDTIAPSQIC